MQRLAIKYIFQVSLHFTIIICIALIYYVNITFVVSGLQNLMDIGSFIASGQFAAEGKNPYSNDSPLILSVKFPKLGHSAEAPNLNPPISVLLFEQIAKVPLANTVWLWRILNVIFYLYFFYSLIREAGEKEPNYVWRSIWIFSLAGFWHTIELGQIYILILLVVLGIVINSEKERPIFAGILLGVLIAIKPNFIFWAFALVSAGYHLIFYIAGFTALFISLFPIYSYGFVIYGQWLEASRVFTPNLLILPGNNSIQGLTARFGSSEAGFLINILLLIITLYIINKYKPAIADINTLAIIVSLLISPVAWTGYTLFLVPGLMRQKKWTTQHWLTASIFSIPFYVVLGLFQNNYFNFIFFGWFFGWGLLILFIGKVTHILKSKPRTASA